MIEYASPDRLIGARLGNYRLEQFLGQGNWGPVFLARTDAAETTYLLRILSGSTTQGVKDRQAYLERFQHQASQIATLQHPNILPLIDYGNYHGMPYVVSPHIATRSLRTRLAKSGPLDVVTVGRYLDQIAATLEYAHQHGVLHGNLSVDCISIRLDGQLVVADFGLVSLFLMDNKEALRDQLNVWSGTCAPEQLLGRPVGPYTDVYALGSVLYALLAGSPVFSGNTPEEIAQQHLYASVPLLSRRRADLPAGLYSIIARALAKDPVQRFHQPGVLANAYQRIVDPHNRSRVPFIVNASPNEQGQQSLASAASQPGMQFTEPGGSSNRPATIDRDYGSQRAGPQTALPYDLPRFSQADSPAPFEAPRFSLMQRFRRKNLRRNTLTVVLVILLLTASIAAGFMFLARQSTGTASVTGQVTFFDDRSGPTGYTNALAIIARGLDTPPAGFQYDAWFINDKNEEVLPLGTLAAGQQSFSLAFHGKNSNGQTDSNLLTAGDKLEITLEQTAAKVPAGQVVLVGAFPPKAFEHIQHLLVGFPETPGKIGLLVGALDQTRLLNIQADVLQSLSTSRDTVAIGCVVQSIIDIVEGVHGPHYRPLTATCASKNVTATGDGYGLLGKGYLLGATEHATFAINQPDATNAMHLHGGLMATALSNIKGWATTIDQDALSLRKNAADLAKVREIAMLADAAYHGVDANGNGQIDPVVGEAGALTAYLQGQLMPTLSLAPRS
jgi:serine/threonine protein kinase